MPTHVAIAFSQFADPEEAAHKASMDILGQLGSHKADMALLLTSSTYSGTPVLNVIQNLIKPPRLIGTTCEGIIVAEGIFTRGIAILAISSDEINFTTATASLPDNADMHGTGFEFGRNLSAAFKGQQRQACLILSDPRFQKDTQFIRGVQEVLGLGFPLLGAVNSDLPGNKSNFQYFQNKAFNQSVSGLLLGGSNVGISSRHGFKPLGKPRTITKATGHIINTIDGKPAFHIYEEYLGPEADKIRNAALNLHSNLYPLGMYMEEAGQYLLKNAVDILPDGSIVCQGLVPEGAEVHLMIGGRVSCRKSAIDAAEKVKLALGDRQAKVIIIIESTARRKILKNGAYPALQAVRDILGNTTPVIGLYASGEIAPLGAGHSIHNTHMQNESIVILGLE